MRYFFDTEFNENVHPIELISLGIEADDGRQFYAINAAYSKHMEFTKNPGTRDDHPHLWSCNDWVKKHVIPIMHINPYEMPDGSNMTISTDEGIKNALIGFVGNDQSPEFWAYYGAYDWFLLTRMFKSFDKMPPKWPQTSYDLHQYARHHGVHRHLPKKFEPAHNALVDARWTKAAFEAVRERAHVFADSPEKPIWP